MSVVPDMGTADFYRLVNVLSDNGIKELDMLGGEPTLHPDLITLIETAVKKDIRISLSTNGSNVPLLENLSRNFDSSRLTIGISLNDSYPDELLLSFIKERRPMIKSICQSDTFLPEYAEDLLAMPDIRYYAIYMDTMHGADLNKGLTFPLYYAELMNRQMKHRNLDGVYCGGFIPDTKNNPELCNVRCPAGTTKLSVMPDGSVYPCYLLFTRPEFKLGNILTDSFKDLIQRPVLNWFRTFKGNQCPSTECELRSSCHGGCPAVSLMISGDINAPDPRCKPLM
jgi:radical SAM protein with 4Fe4S-binding SPASM domain